MACRTRNVWFGKFYCFRVAIQSSFRMLLVLLLLLLLLCSISWRQNLFSFVVIVFKNFYFFSNKNKIFHVLATIFMCFDCDWGSKPVSASNINARTCFVRSFFGKKTDKNSSNTKKLLKYYKKKKKKY